MAAYEYAVVLVNRSTFSDNSAVYGGALFAQLYTTLNISNSDVYQNTGKLCYIYFDQYIV